MTLYLFLIRELCIFHRAVLVNIPVITFIGVLCCLDGLVIFAVYSDCDLAKEGKITRNDQVRRVT